MFITVDQGWIIVEGTAVVKADDTEAILKLARHFLPNAESLTHGVTCSSSVDFADEYGVPKDIDVREILAEAMIMAADPRFYYADKFRQHCEEAGEKGPTKRMRVHLSAMTCVRFSAVVDVPEGMEDEAVDWFYDEVEGEDYYDDTLYWERGHCYIESEDERKKG